MALDPTAFTADDSAVDRVAAAAAPRDTRTSQQVNVPGLRSPAAGYREVNALERVTAQSDGFESDDDFDPTLTRARCGERHDAVVLRRPDVSEAVSKQSVDPLAQLETFCMEESRPDGPSILNAVPSAIPGSVGGVVKQDFGTEQPLVQTPIYHQVSTLPDTVGGPLSQDKVMTVAFQPDSILVSSAPTPLQPEFHGCTSANLTSFSMFAETKGDVPGQASDPSLQDRPECDAQQTYIISHPASGPEQPLQHNSNTGSLSIVPAFNERKQADEALRAACRQVNVSECGIYNSAPDKGAPGFNRKQVLASPSFTKASEPDHRLKDQVCTGIATCPQQRCSVGESDSTDPGGRNSEQPISDLLLNVHPARAVDMCAHFSAEAVVDNGLGSNNQPCISSIIEVRPTPENCDVACSVVSNTKSKKSRAQRELERLSIFNWDKRKVQHPVGKLTYTLFPPHIGDLDHSDFISL